MKGKDIIMKNISIITLLLALIMVFCAFPFYALSANTQGTVVSAADFDVTLSSNANSFYGLKSLDTETGIYTFTGEKTSWNVNEDNSLISIALNVPAANKYFVIGATVSATNPSKTNNIKLTVDNTASYLNADFSNCVGNTKYILVDASSVISSSAMTVNSIGILPFETGKNVGGAYSAGIESIAYFSDITVANDYIASKNTFKGSVINAPDFNVTLSSNATSFYGSKSLDAETGIYTFTGVKTDWSVNEDNSLINIALNASAKNKYIVLGISVNANYPSKDSNIKLTVDSTPVYVSADLSDCADGIKYILADASSVITSGAMTINSIGILPFESGKNSGTGYSAAIESIALFSSASDAAGYIVDMTPDIPMEDRVVFDSTYKPQSKTLNALLPSDYSTYISAKTLYEELATYGNTRSLEEKDGETYLRLSTPAGTYGNGHNYFALACEELDYNVVDNKYFKMVYYTDYARTMNISINGYANSVFSGETWLSSGSNPSAKADGSEITYILDLTKLDAKVTGGITSDYTKFNLMVKPLNSGSQTTTEETNVYIKYMGFFKSEAEALAFEPARAASADMGSYNTDALVDAAVAFNAEYIDLTVPGDINITDTNVNITSEFISYLTENAPDTTVNVNTNAAKITLTPSVLSELCDFENDVVLAVNETDAGVYVAFTDNLGEEIDVVNKVRVLLNRASGDLIATVDGALDASSGIICGRAAANVMLPATVNYEIAESLDFADANVNWAKEDIDFVTSRSLFNGVNTLEFAPNGHMTRSMAAAVLNRISGESVNTSTNSYTDLPADAWYAQNVEWAYVNGIAEDGITKFRPDVPITREELAGFIYRYASSQGIDTTAPASSFTDSANIINTAAVDYCVANGIINGYPDGSFKPRSFATRAEVAAMISRFIKSALKVNDIDIMDYQDIAFDESDIKLTFVAMSDIHISSAKQTDGCYENYKNAMDAAYALAVTGDIDLVFAAGDLVQNLAYNPTADANNDGVIDQKDSTKLYEIDAFKAHTDAVLRDDTYILFTTGNHDRSSQLSYEDYFYNAFNATTADTERYYRFDVVEDCEYDKGNRHSVINGYHFLSIGMFQDPVAYVQPILEELTASDPYTPVFIQYHYPAADTVYVSRFTGPEETALRKLLDNYPQVVYFSGHTHAALENPRAIWQGTFTALDTASVRDLDDNGLIRSGIKIPINATHSEVFKYASEATLIEVDANNNIRFRAYNTYRGDVVNEFVIAGPNENDTHLLTYTDEREAYSKAPEFKKNTEFTLTKLADNHIGVKFDQAKHDDVVWYYTIDMAADGYETERFYFFSRYFDPNGMPEVIDCTLYTDAHYVSTGDNHAGLGHTLTEGVTYTATLTAYDAWDHPSDPIVIEYTA